MNIEEFSNQFDVLVDSYRRFKNFDDQLYLDSIEFNEYEKSIYLTRAQEDIVLSLYNGKNIYGDSFESSEELRRSLESLIRITEITDFEESNRGKFNSSKLELPDDLWLIVKETVTNNNNNVLLTIPTTQEDSYKILENPFKGPSKKRALRLDIGEGFVELLTTTPITKYEVTYLCKLTPIILIDLPKGLSINGMTSEMSCVLNDMLHNKILERAVELALSSKVRYAENK